MGKQVIQAQSIQPGNIVGKVRVRDTDYTLTSLPVNSSRFWVHYPGIELQTHPLFNCPVYPYTYSTLEVLCSGTLVYFVFKRKLLER